MESKGKFYTLNAELFQNKEQRVVLLEAGQYDSLVPHNHIFTEVVFIKSGLGIHVANGKETCVKTGDMFIISKHDTVHYIKPIEQDDQFKIYNLIISDHLFDINLDDIDPNELFTDQDICDLTKVFNAIYEEEKNKEYQYQNVINSYALYLLSMAERIDIQRKNKEKHLLSDDYVMIAKEYIRQNYQNQITVSDVANECKISAYYLQELFERKSSLSVKQYLTNVRLQNVCYKLYKTDESINNIADKCGFTDYKYFYKVFKEHFSITPAEYRKKFK